MTPGYYLYSRPGWTGKNRVKVTEQNGELMVSFKEGYYPSKVNDSALDAIWEPTDPGKLELVYYEKPSNHYL